jgi:cyclopropane fatty-acyl-phospholipid synthase-like methyltransferase
MSLVLTCNQDVMREKAVDFIKSKGFILELGCGDGNFAKILFDNGYTNYLGVDLLEKNILACKEAIPSFKFWTANVFSSRVYSKILEAKTIVSFQTFEHLGTTKGHEDIGFLLSFPSGKHLIFSVPNSPYRKEHKRWFELDGWRQRYKDILIFNDSITIQNPKKPDKRSFLFDAVVR